MGLVSQARDLYSVIKGQDAYLRFAFLTGVSTFSKGNLFSGLNNLEDITLDPAYSSLCGYTDADSVFAPELDGLDRNQIRRWYNGYNWLGTSVYNPFDLLLLLLFRRRVFKAWWMETGNPTFLTQLLVQEQFFMPDLAVLLPERIYLFEFKVVELLPEGQALAQLRERGYADKYRGHGVPIWLVGVEFSRTASNVVGFDSAQIGPG